MKIERVREEGIFFYGEDFTRDCPEGLAEELWVRGSIEASPGLEARLVPLIREYTNDLSYSMDCMAVQESGETDEEFGAALEDYFDQLSGFWCGGDDTLPTEWFESSDAPVNKEDEQEFAFWLAYFYGRAVELSVQERCAAGHRRSNDT